MNTLKEKSTLELKGLAYDVSLAIQQYQQTLQVLNAEINERAKEELKKAQEKPVVHLINDTKKEESSK